MPTLLDFENELRASFRTTSVEKARFRSEFQRSVRESLRIGRQLEEAFGIAWERAAEEVSISEEGQSELFEELIRWAKNRR